MTEAREPLLRQAAEAAIEHLAGLPDRAVAPTPAALAALAALPSAVPAHGRDASEVLRELAEVGGPAMHASGGGRYFGFVTGGSLPVAAAADWLTTAWDQNAWSAATSPGAAAFERKAVAGLLATLGMPGEGALCSGATGANVIALTAARDAVLAAAGWDVAAEGLVGAPPVAVYVGAEAHSSVLKALGVVGLGRSGRGKHVTTLATDPAGAVRAGAFAGLPPPAGPAIVVLQAGHVNTGAFDDFDPDEDYEPPQALSFREEMAESWSDSIAAMKRFFKELTLFVIALSPWLLILFGLLLLIRRFFRRLLAKRRKTSPKQAS